MKREIIFIAAESITDIHKPVVIAKPPSKIRILLEKWFRFPVKRYIRTMK